MRRRLRGCLWMLRMFRHGRQEIAYGRACRRGTRRGRCGLESRGWLPKRWRWWRQGAALMRHLTLGLRLVQPGGHAGDGRQLGRIRRYRRAREVAGIVGEAWRGKVIGALRRRRQRVCGGTGDWLRRRQTRGSAPCMARSQVGEHAGGRHGARWYARLLPRYGDGQLPARAGSEGDRAASQRGHGANSNNNMTRVSNKDGSAGR